MTRSGLATSYRDGAAGGAELVIVRRWLKSSRYQILVSIMATAVAIGMTLLGAKAGFPVLFFVIVGFIGVVGLYQGAAHGLNTTRITVGL